MREGAARSPRGPDPDQPGPASVGDAPVLQDAEGRGDAGRTEAALGLPSPCIAPIVFVTSPGGAWLAATGG